jgi:hypothetical protein
MSDFYSLRECNLEPSLVAKLAPFISSHRPHDEIVPKSELGPRIDQKEETTMEEIERLQTHQTFYRQEYIRLQNIRAYQILSELHYEEETE